MRVPRWVILISLAAPLCAGYARAQDQQDNSVAAAARRAQEEKKEQPKATKVYDNDNIPSSGAVNVIGQDQQAGGAGSDNGNAQAAQETKPAPTADELTSLSADLASAKQRLADLKADLDIAQRKYALDQQTYLSNPNHQMDKAGAAALAGEKSDIDAKADAVAAAEKALAAAQAKLDAANQAARTAAQDQAAQNQASQASSNNSAPAAPPAATAAPPADAPVSDKDR